MPTTNKKKALQTILAANSPVPCSDASQTSIDFSGQCPADLATIALLKKQLHIMQRNEPGIKEDIDIEFLHDFRVALRRTRAGLSEIKGVFAKDITLRYKKKMQQIGHMTNRLRDLDVYLLKKDYYSAMLPDPLQAPLHHLFKLLCEEREYEKRSLIKKINGTAYQDIIGEWDNFLMTYPLNAKQSGANAQIPVVILAQKYILKTWKKVMSSGRAITDQSTATELHLLRLQCKKMRYLMEFFAGLFPAKKLHILIRHLKELQENLGDFNDLSVQQKTLQLHLNNLDPGSKQHIDIAATIGGLLANLHIQQQQVRKLFNTTYRRFDCPKNNRIIEKLFVNRSSPKTHRQ